MGFFKRLFGMGAAKEETRFLPFYVYSRRCNEPLAGKIDTMNELSIAEEGDAAWYARKVVQTTGRNRCFDSIEVEIWFDQNKQPLRRNVTGGQWLEFDEYDRLVKARASTLVDDTPGAAAATAPSAPAENQEPAQNSIRDTREMPGGNQNTG